MNDPARTHTYAAARAYRLVLAAFDSSDAGRDAFDRILAEIRDCADCVRAVHALLADFGDSRIRCSIDSEHAERWLNEHTAGLLDALAEAKE